MCAITEVGVSQKEALEVLKVALSMERLGVLGEYNEL